MYVSCNIYVVFERLAWFRNPAFCSARMGARKSLVTEHSTIYRDITCNIDLLNSIFFKHYGDRKNIKHLRLAKYKT